MGKASSAKKVARAARAGGGRRPGQRRQLGFPALITVIIVFGVGLVLFARSEREANAEPFSAAAETPSHWHAAYGLSFCGDFVHDTEGDFLVDIGPDTLGIHTHGDGVMHIHPFTDRAAGRDAKLGLFFNQVGLDVSDSEVAFPDGETWSEDEDTCLVDNEEVPGQIVLAKWDDAQDAADGERPNHVYTEDFGDVRYEADREYYTLAFVPEGQLEDIPVRPDILNSLNNLSDVIEAPESSTSSTTAGDGEGGADPSASSSTSSTDTTATTAAGESGTTTATTAPPAG